MPDDIFDRVKLFEGLSFEQRRFLRPLFVPCDCYTETVLFEQGDQAEFLYLVVSGEVTIRYKPEDGPPITVSRVRSGGIVGWSAALGSRYYTSGAECSVYTQMLRVRGEDLRDLCDHYPETGVLILERMAAVIAERLSSTHEHVISMLKQGMSSGSNHI